MENHHVEWENSLYIHGHVQQLTAVSLPEGRSSDQLSVVTSKSEAEQPPEACWPKLRSKANSSRYLSTVMAPTLLHVKVG